MGQQALIARYIEEHPHKPGPADAVLIEEGVPIWALIGALPAAGGDPSEVARSYDISDEAMAAALAYYEHYRAYIDARLLLNRAPAV